VKYFNQESEREVEFDKQRRALLQGVSAAEVANNPMLWIDRRTFTNILTKVEMFNMVKNVQGSIVECGVYQGNGLSTYYHLSSILEPVAFNRKVIGFDTFEGFPAVTNADSSSIPERHLSDVNYDLLIKVLEINDLNRNLGHIPKIDLVKGDATKTIPEYVKSHPELIISLLYLDFDIYEPTRIALEYLLPLVPRGGVIGFDELNQKKWQGETIALKEVMNLSKINLRKFGFDPHVSYFVVE